MKITVKVATTETVSKSVHFDENALLALENTASGTPVTENFDKKVGVVLSAKLQEDGLFVECEIKEGVLDKLRSKTFDGIAQAMAEQWAGNA